MENIKILNKFLDYQVIEIEKKQTIDEFIKIFSLNIEQVIYEKNNLTKGDIVIVKDINRIIHVVRPLENLESIAKKYNVSVEYLMEKNNINKIFIGQQIYI